LEGEYQNCLYVKEKVEWKFSSTKLYNNAAGTLAYKIAETHAEVRSTSARLNPVYTSHNIALLLMPKAFLKA
jgi:hypothetical protein